MDLEETKKKIRLQTLLAELKEPFAPELIKWRVGSTNEKWENGKKVPGSATQGLALAYVDARDIMNRLDDVVGFDKWQSKLIPTPGGFVCELGLKIDGEWVWKANSADDTQVEAIKGAASDALKRAAVLWGIGRYLYDLPNQWCPIKARGKSYVLESVPSLPDWALPGKKQDLSEGVLNVKGIEIVLQDIRDLNMDEAQKKQFTDWLKENELTFGTGKGGWNVKDEHLEAIYIRLSEIVEPI